METQTFCREGEEETLENVNSFSSRYFKHLPLGLLDATVDRITSLNWLMINKPVRCKQRFQLYFVNLTATHRNVYAN